MRDWLTERDCSATRLGRFVETLACFVSGGVMATHGLLWSVLATVVGVTVATAVNTVADIFGGYR